MVETDTFIKVLDPEDTTTGGGSASSISGAMAGALIAMVCLVCAKSQEAAGEELFRRSAEQAKTLSDALLAGGKQDSLAFQAVRHAYKLPRGTEEERSVRSQAVQAAWLEAARVPLTNAAGCYQVAQLGEQLSEMVLPQVRSDLICAILLARAGALGCLENVAINLPSIKDQTAAAELAEEAAQLRSRLDALNLPN
jgi:formiminotetrahydrofolate cyclodeaminase